MEPSEERYHPVMVYVTCPDSETADSLAQALVDACEAACVNIVPGVKSYYRWENETQMDHEVLLLIKTQQTRLKELRNRVAEIHPDDTPEIVAVPIVDGSPEYLTWLVAETAV